MNSNTCFKKHLVLCVSSTGRQRYDRSLRSQRVLSNVISSLDNKKGMRHYHTNTNSEEERPPQTNPKSITHIYPPQPNIVPPKHLFNEFSKRLVTQFLRTPRIKSGSKHHIPPTLPPCLYSLLILIPINIESSTVTFSAPGALRCSRAGPRTRQIEADGGDARFCFLVKQVGAMRLEHAHERRDVGGEVELLGRLWARCGSCLALCCLAAWRLPF